MALQVSWSWRGSRVLRPLLKQAIRRWSGALSGGPGLSLSVVAAPVDGVSGALAETQVLQEDAITGLPVAARITVDVADLPGLVVRRSARRGMTAVLRHELAHALGFGLQWGERGLSDERGYLGGGGVREYLALGGSGDRVPLEGGSALMSRGLHWSEQRFGSELMTSGLESWRAPLSRLTLGAMEDLGYQVNWAAAEPYSLAG